MSQCELFDNIPSDTKRQFIGIGLTLELQENNGKPKPKAILYKNGSSIKIVDLCDHVAKRLLVVEAVELGAIKLRLAEVIGISRQTIDNYLQSVKVFGYTGLLNNYNPNRSKNIREQRKLRSQDRLQGNTAQQLAEMRKQDLQNQQEAQMSLDFSFEGKEQAESVTVTNQPYTQQHEWKATRYAGIFTYLITLVAKWKWFDLVQGYFGDFYKIFMVFLFMAARNIRSLEALKNERHDEVGAVLGIGKLPSKPILWQLFRTAAEKCCSSSLLKDYFLYQIRRGLVGTWLWFIDGHLLPYTGKRRVHYAYNTQRRMPVPGRTSMVMTDGSGRVVDFEIHEGKGDLRSFILATKPRWEHTVPIEPLRVFDREGRGVDFFRGMVRNRVPFATWDTNVDKSAFDVIDDAKFTEEFEVNGKQYAVFEKPKVFTYETGDSAGGMPIKESIRLRHIFLWNKSANRKTCGLSWTGEQPFSTVECAGAIIARWGASENTFKHLNMRHPGNYQPGFKFSKSTNQTIANPEMSSVDKRIRMAIKDLNILYKKQVNAQDIRNSDGTVRKNSLKKKLTTRIDELEKQLKEERERKKQLPERIDVSTLTDYASFKKIDNEGKTLFDFVTSSVWNGRKLMVDWLRPLMKVENELVDLFYAIANCHGWIRCTTKEVIVRLEPMQTPIRRAAQEQLCRKLTGLFAKTPNGKLMIIEVGNQPK